MTQNGKVALVRRGDVALAKRMESLEEYVMPAVDIYETPDAFVLKADMPGIAKESISIYAEPGVLHIKGIIAQTQGDMVNVLYNEIRKNSFFRKFNIGNGINADSIEATVADGVLTILLPKNESMRVREIPIK